MIDFQIALTIHRREDFAVHAHAMLLVSSPLLQAPDIPISGQALQNESQKSAQIFHLPYSQSRYMRTLKLCALIDWVLVKSE